jgi:GT2 family glycosyltransferase
MNLTSIVIPSWNGLHLLGHCISEIRRFTDHPHEIIVADDGSTDGTADFCRRERIVFVSLPRNRGFPVAANAGIKLAAGDTVVLMNNDIIVSRRWLDNMLACLYSADDIGIVGPMTNYASGIQHHPLGYADLTAFHEMTREANRPDPGKWKGVNRLVGMCMVIRRQVIDRIGLLDERYAPGHYEDDDYCYRARQDGWRLMVAGDTYVHHHGSASFRKMPQTELAGLLAANRQKFIDKFGADPLMFI